MLLEYLYRDVFSLSNVFFDNDMIEACIKYIETFFFPLADYQKFLIPFTFLMIDEDDIVKPYFKRHMWTLARANGKTGLFAGLSNFLQSPLYNIKNYNISIVANSEAQAAITFDEVYDKIKEQSDTLGKFFYVTKTNITGIQNNSSLIYKTSNASTKDGLRDAMIGFDEFHEYPNDELLNVFESGTLKVPHSRIYYIGTNGFYRDGVYDQKIELAKNILTGVDTYSRMFPFICKLDNLSEVDDPDMWQKANPILEGERTAYSKNMFSELKTEYHGIKSGQTDKVKFFIKNMNTLVEDTSRTAIPREELIAATRPYQDTSMLSSIGACDFAQSRDFTACGILFLDENNEYIWKHHSFVNKHFLDKINIKAPIEEWEKQGLLTIVNDVLIKVEYVVDWFVKMRDENPSLKTIVIDMHKLNTLKTPLEEAGFEVLWIRNPRLMSGQISDKIDRVFGERKIAWGNDPMMRWYTNNVYIDYDKQGNKVYEKKEELKRKTDGFMALVYAFYFADTRLIPSVDFLLDDFFDDM